MTRRKSSKRIERLNVIFAGLENSQSTQSRHLQRLSGKRFVQRFGAVFRRADRANRKTHGFGERLGIYRVNRLIIQWLTNRDILKYAGQIFVRIIYLNVCREFCRWNSMQTLKAAEIPSTCPSKIENNRSGNT